MMKALKAKARRAAWRSATRPATAWCNWLIWTFGGKLGRRKDNKGRIDSPETLRALEYGKELYATFIPGTLSGSTRTTTRRFSTARSR